MCLQHVLELAAPDDVVLGEQLDLLATHYGMKCAMNRLAGIVSDPCGRINGAG